MSKQQKLDIVSSIFAVIGLVVFFVSASRDAMSAAVIAAAAVLIVGILRVIFNPKWKMPSIRRSEVDRDADERRAMLARR